jgi:hypothetical protein
MIDVEKLSDLELEELAKDLRKDSGQRPGPAYRSNPTSQEAP